MSIWTPVLFVAAFAAMEVVAVIEHRWVMHGVGWSWHRSHHQVPGRRHLEANDRFPILFAVLAIVAFLVGTQVDGWAWLIPVAAGMTTYGASYTIVHEGYIHGRLGVRLPRMAVLDRLAAAHMVHHRHNGAPFGMLVPMVPAEYRHRDGVETRPDGPVVPGPSRMSGP